MASRFGREAAGELGVMVKSTLRTILPHPVCYPTIVAPTSLKKFVTGKGTGVKKEQMLLATYRKWCAEFADNNLADAFGLAKIAEALSSESTEHLLSYERDVISRLRKHTEWSQGAVTTPSPSSG